MESSLPGMQVRIIAGTAAPWFRLEQDRAVVVEGACDGMSAAFRKSLEVCVPLESASVHAGDLHAVSGPVFGTPLVGHSHIITFMGRGRDKRKRLAKRTAHTPASPPTDQPGGGDPGALVGASLKPRPHLSSGAVALPEPYPVEEEADFRSPNRLRR